MILIENTEVVGWEHAIRGIRNPMNSWDKSDSDIEFCWDGDYCRVIHKPRIGPNDLALMKKLAQAGTDHRKFLRMIVVYCDITAPLYWWKEFDTYKVGTVANSCSTMHKIHSKEFTLEDFSHEHLTESLTIEAPGSVCVMRLLEEPDSKCMHRFLDPLKYTIVELNTARRMYLETKDKRYWWQMIQMLPTSYNQKRTVMLNYEVLANIYKPTSRQHHKQDEWNVDCPGSFCKWIESLPYSQLITGKEGEADG